MENKYSVVITTCDSKKAARAIARSLIEKQIAACVQMFPVESVYFWNDMICEDDEIVLFVKTKPELYKKAEAAIRESHPYELPEIIQLPITDGFPDYLSWIDERTGD